jgi:hypothetical protein
MPPVTRGKQYNRTTKLGKLMYDRGLSAKMVCEGTGIYARTMTEILAGRAYLNPQRLAVLCAFLKVPPEAIME